MLIEDEMDRLIMIPGPTPVEREILEAIGRPTIAHTSRALADIIRNCQDGLREAAGAAGARAFIFAGSGTLAQESAIVNVVGPGERLLVASNGYFGDRFVSVAECHGIAVDCLAAEWGTSVDAAQLRERLVGGQYAAVTITHVDTSTGVAAPVEELARAAREFGTLVILDSVCALGGMPLQMERWGVDVVLTGAQKALGVPPGLALLLVSERAMDRRRALDRIPAFYADLANWEASMSDPQVYFSTHAVNLFYALEAAIEIVRKEGLEERVSRHDHLSRAFRAGMSAHGFTSLANEHVLAPTLSVLAYPPGVEDATFREQLAAHGVVAAGCLGPFKGKGTRFGHMGNISETEIFQTLLAVGRTLDSLGVSSRSAEAVQRALSVQS